MGYAYGYLLSSEIQESYDAMMSWIFKEEALVRHLMTCQYLTFSNHFMEMSSHAFLFC